LELESVYQECLLDELNAFDKQIVTGL